MHLEVKHAEEGAVSRLGGVHVLGAILEGVGLGLWLRRDIVFALIITKAMLWILPFFVAIPANRKLENTVCGAVGLVVFIIGQVF